MKKIFLGAITLMLAMGLNTSCSENQVEDLMQTTPQVAESKSMTLDLSVAQAAGTRVEVEGIDGKDAFKVTGWSDNDQIKVAYNSPEGMNFADFFYSAKDKQFHGDVPSFVQEKDLKAAFYAGIFCDSKVEEWSNGVYAPMVGYLNGWDSSLSEIDWRKAAPLAGMLSVADGKVVGTLEPQCALVCVHNTTPIDLDIALMNSNSNFLYQLFVCLDSDYNQFVNYVYVTSSKDYGFSVKIAAGDKAYLPLISGYSIAEKSSRIMLSPERYDIQNGKVYKLNLGNNLNIAKVTPGMGGMITLTSTDSSVDLWEECVLMQQEDVEYTATATPKNENYAFVNWTDGKDGKVLSTDPSYTFKISDGVSPYANFSIEAVTWRWSTRVQNWCENYENVTTFEIQTEVGGTMPIGAYVLDEDNLLWAITDGTTAKLCTPAKQIRLINGDGVFQSLNSLKEIKGLDKLNTENVTSMSRMFYGCKSLTNLDLSGFNTENVTTMYAMFYNCNSLMSLDLSNFNTANVDDMRRMFFGCNSLTSLDLSKLNTVKVDRMEQMFSMCSSLTSLDLSGFNTENVNTMYRMFYNCISLKSLDLSMFNTAKVEDMTRMFYYCKNLSELKFGENFKLANAHEGMFYLTATEGLCIVKGVNDPEVKTRIKQETEWDSNHLCFDNDGTTIPNMNYQEW